MFENILLGIGWTVFFLSVAWFVPWAIVASFQFWMNFVQNIRVARREKKEHK